MKKGYMTCGLVICLFMVSISCSKKLSEDDSIFSVDSSHSLPLEHSFGVGDKFSSRGNIIFRGSKVGYASFKSSIELTNDDVDKLQRLVADNGLYFIRSPTRIGATFASDEADNNTATKYVQTFVKACYLYGSRLKEVITVSLDYSGNVIGLNIVSPRSPCSIDTHYMNVPTIFNSSVYVQQQVAGAVPDAQTFTKKREQEAADAKDPKKDNRSFLAKYWMYILPVFLILMLSSQAEQPAEGGGE